MDNVIYFTSKEKFLKYEQRVREEYIIPYADGKLANLGYQNLLYKGRPLLYFDTDDIVFLKADL